MSQDSPQGFVLSEAAYYAFQCQDVYPDILSFAAAIPDYLKPLFLIPIKLESVSTASIAMRVASIPSGNTPESELFSDKTFVNYDNEPSVPSSEPGSIFEVNDYEHMTHHQDNNYDENVIAPDDTSYMNDFDVTEFNKYPYRTLEKPRHSSTIPHVLLVRLALKPEALETHTPQKIQDNSKACAVTLVSYDKNTRVFTFDVKASSTPRRVQASLSEIDHIALSCNCPFWRYNGPEFHAKENSFMLGQPFGTATSPDVRDPDRQYWMCKHAYAVMRRLESFVQQVTEENWELDDDELLSQVDEEWDRMEGTALVPAEDLERDDEELEVNWGEETPEDDALEEQVDDEPAAEDSETSEEEQPEPAEEPAPESEEIPVETYDVEESEDVPVETYDVEESEPEFPAEEEVPAETEEQSPPTEEPADEPAEEVQDYSGDESEESDEEPEEESKK